ncbi:hypothetical protein PROFUN_11722 [Planoprotostelium fungivorum]|uniref:Uncharacterized protein n=1 Tax=Planoprotostelium fungivorum TaxID=1890364 RepID=A0A2P6N987_9EUKA|nr:hypothetical protein PROFUN_11722 [Planoprotostelium fungivorum]
MICGIKTHRPKVEVAVLQCDDQLLHRVIVATGQQTFFYEDANTSVFTLTCERSNLGLYDPPRRMNFTLVKMNGQGVYGQTYNVDGLLVLQYPPVSALAGVFFLNLTGSVSTLTRFDDKSDLKRTVQYLVPMETNSIRTNTSDAYRYIVAVRGQGQLTVNLGTPAGVNVGYDQNYSLYPSTYTTKPSISTISPLNTVSTVTSPVSAAGITSVSIVSVVLILLGLL